MGVLGALALAAAAALLILTAALHTAAGRMAAEIEKVRLAEELEIALLARTPPVTGALPAKKLRQRLDDLQAYLTTQEGRALIEEARGKLERWLATPQGATPAQKQPPPPRELVEAVAAFDHLSKLGVEQAHVSLARVVRWTHVADIIAWAVGALLLLAVVVSLVWLHGLAFAPVVRIGDTMQRFAGGDLSARAAERGPAEMRSIARQFNALADELQRRRGSELALLAGIAHDLRNPLGAIKTAIAVAAPERPLPPEPQLRRLVALIGRQLDRLTRMTSDLIDGARLETGRLDLKVERADLREIATDVVELYRAGSPGREIRLSLPAEPLVVPCDATRIAQLLGNLVSNALKYSPAGKPVVVAMRRSGEEALASVADEGPGIAPDQQAHVFEPFRRGDTTQSIPGVGLGLFVARRVAQAHGGSLGFVSHAGAGSTFTLRLPLPGKAEERTAGREGRPAETPS